MLLVLGRVSRGKSKIICEKAFLSIKRVQSEINLSRWSAHHRGAEAIVGPPFSGKVPILKGILCLG